MNPILIQAHLSAAMAELCSVRTPDHNRLKLARGFIRLALDEAGLKHIMADPDWPDGSVPTDDEMTQLYKALTK